MAEETTQENGPQLSLQDLVLMMNLIRATAERGAIRAEEMTEVGTVYNKLVAFLQYSGAIKTPEAPAEDSASTEQGPVDSEGGQPD
jgi:hypothetical protein